MANLCWNMVTFRGAEANLSQMRTCFSELAQKGYGLPEFVGKECGVFFDLSQKNDTITYHSRYNPNLNAVAQTAEHFGLDYTHSFNEFNMGVMGEANRVNGDYSITRLIGQDINLGIYDAACDHVAYNGQFYGTIYDLMPVLLADKKALAESEPVKERLSGKLPHLDIAGTDFTIDWQNKRLIKTDSPDNILEIGEDALKKNGNELFFLYDRNTHKLINGNPAIHSLPQEACMLDLPYQGYLDPVALARETDMYDTDFLLVYPYHKHQVAGIVEISEILNQQASRQRGV